MDRRCSYTTLCWEPAKVKRFPALIHEERDLSLTGENKQQNSHAETYHGMREKMEEGSTNPVKPKIQFTRFTKPQNKTTQGLPIPYYYSSMRNVHPWPPINLPPCEVSPSAFGYCAFCPAATQTCFKESLF